MYVSALKTRVKKDLDAHPELKDRIRDHVKKFITWCAKQRVIYEADIFDEIEEFEQKYIKSRLYTTDIKLWKEIQHKVFERDDYTCRYCGKTGVILEVDHIVPISKGGTNDYDNLATACRRCNRQKKDKTVEEFQEWRGKH
jgi:CRISPR/Cas system Type II protein with McrA/HNH and RuvC-like nuclease domain